MRNQSEQATPRRPPGILAVLPETLTYYPYRDDHDGGRQYLHKRRGRKRQNDSEQIITIEEFGCQTEVIPDEPLGLMSADKIINSKNGFTLFFFCDSNNRQSLKSIPIISKWCYHALNCGGECNDDSGIPPDSRVICIPNQPSPHEINVHNSTIDSISQASINASATTGSATKGHVLSILKGTGATRVPSIIVVSNATGRIVTRYGWEAIEREGGPGGLLERWIDSSFVTNKKEDGNDESACFESNIVSEWKLGRSGLPMWWHIVSFIL
eukprot:scaffold5581_cov156-Skeletonema_marinoi.AAC.15